MTAADALSVQPAARPEPSAAKASEADTKASDPKAKTFADMLDAQTTNNADAPEADATPTDREAKEDGAALVAAPSQPAPVAVAPVTTSPAAILAGLDPNAIANNAAPKAGAVEGVEPTNAPQATAQTPSAALQTLPVDASTAGMEALSPEQAGQEVVAQQVANGPKPSLAKPTTQTIIQDGADQTVDSSDDASETGSDQPAADAAKAKPVANTAPTQPFAAALSTPTSAAAPAPSLQPASAPGAERAAAAVEGPSSTTTKGSSASVKALANADANAQASTNKTLQAGPASADQALQVKVDTAPSNLASNLTSDALSASRMSGTEAGKSAQASATQAAPAASIQVYSRMIERFDGRAQRFEIRLDPAELGRVDVRIEVGADKKVHAVLAAHDSAALSDLMRGQRALENSLRQAGIDLADGGIKFELSGDTGSNLSNSANQGETNANANGSGNVWRNFSTIDVKVDGETAAASRPWRSTRLDLVA